MNATHWSTRSMAREIDLDAVGGASDLEAFGLQPHRQETLKLSTDPQFVAKVRDVVGLYLNPPERAVVLCVDEKSQIQALDRTAPILPMLPGRARARDPRLQAPRHDQPLRRAGRHHRQGHRPLHAATARSSSSSSCRRIDREVPAELDVHLVLDNNCTHKSRRSSDWLTAHPRFVLHFTPTIELVAEPRRALVRRADHQEAAPRRAPLRPRPQRRHPRLDRDLERRPHALRLDQDRRPDPRIHRPLLHPNQRITTLARRCRGRPTRRRAARPAAARGSARARRRGRPRRATRRTGPRARRRARTGPTTPRRWRA